MARIIVLGSSAEFPFPRTKSNKFEDYLDIENYEQRFELHNDPLCNWAKKGGRNRRTRSALALIIRGRVILFDAGPDIRCQLKKYRLHPDAVFISHAHPDADYGLRYLKGVKVFSEQEGNVNFGEDLEIFGIKILPFRVQHSKIAPCTGYKIKLRTKITKPKTIVYVTDMASLRNMDKYFKGCDILFADGSILKRSLPGHLSIINQLKFYKKWRLKRVIFTHIGHQTLPHKNLSQFIKSQYKNAEVAYDGMVISI